MKKEVFVFALIFILFGSVELFAAADGFAERTKGGESGRLVNAYNENDLVRYLESSDEYKITVYGTIKLTRKIQALSGKTIQGANYSSTITGESIELTNQNNFIIRNLNFDYSGISISNSSDVYITQCMFSESQNGMIIINNGKNITVSLCKFYFSKEPSFVCIIDNSQVTLHGNWFESCDRCMPMVSKSVIHMYNNYFRSEGSSWGTAATDRTQILSENNYYERITNPIFSDNSGKIQAIGNIYSNCAGTIDEGKSQVFKPPYKYSLFFTVIVPQVARQYCGNLAQ